MPDWIYEMAQTLLFTLLVISTFFIQFIQMMVILNCFKEWEHIIICHSIIKVVSIICFQPYTY